MADERDAPPTEGRDGGPSGNPAEDWQPGQLVAHRYLLERPLGGGSTGDVWLAEDRLLRKPVALKVLQHHLAQNRETVHRFLREVALAHSVTHRNVVRIYDTGETQGRPYFTMEYLQGMTLEELLEDGRDGERLSNREIRQIAFDVLDAMEAAHRVGVVHRDLKPGNVMLTHRGAIVMDFGVAGIEEVSEAPNAASARSLVRTEAGTIFGSPAYMAPELWEGAPASVQSDLYAFGVMLYQMLSGRLPYDAGTVTEYLQQVNRAPPTPLRSLRRDAPWSLLRLVRRCMATRPSDRPASAAAAAYLIAPLRDKARRRLLVLAGAGALVIVLAMALRAEPSHAQLGLPDAVAEADLAAAVRMYDAGDSLAALRTLERRAETARHAAALGFWRAVLHDAIGDEAGRREVCRGAQWRGSPTWVARAEAACGPHFALPEQTLADLEHTEPELLPLAVTHELLPRLETAPAGDTLRAARAVLGRMETPPETTAWSLDTRWALAGVHLELALGRYAEASEHLDALLAEEPLAPAVLSHRAWLSMYQGDLDRAAELARAVVAVDPTPAVALLMRRGRMARAWRVIEQHEHSPRHAGLVQLWCGYALRFEMHPPPAQCEALAPSLAAALWHEEHPTTELAPREAKLVQRARTVAQGSCEPDPQAPVQLTHAPTPFELRLGELEVEAALCRADPARADLDRAQELARKLLAMAPEDPWIALLRARVDAARGEPTQAHSGRLRVSELWRRADARLPLVQQVRGWEADAVVSREGSP